MNTEVNHMVAITSHDGELKHMTLHCISIQLFQIHLILQNPNLIGIKIQLFRFNINLVRDISVKIPIFTWYNQNKWCCTANLTRYTLTWCIIHLFVRKKKVRIYNWTQNVLLFTHDLTNTKKWPNLKWIPKADVNVMIMKCWLSEACLMLSAGCFSALHHTYTEEEKLLKKN